MHESIMTRAQLSSSTLSSSCSGYLCIVQPCRPAAYLQQDPGVLACSAWLSSRYPRPFSRATIRSCPTYFSIRGLPERDGRLHQASYFWVRNSVFRKNSAMPVPFLACMGINPRRLLYLVCSETCSS